MGESEAVTQDKHRQPRRANLQDFSGWGAAHATLCADENHARTDERHHRQDERLGVPARDRFERAVEHCRQAARWAEYE